MFDFFINGGLYMWLMLILFVFVIGLFIKKLIQIQKQDLRLPQDFERGLWTIPFWGIISLALGFYGHYHGVYMAMLNISQANDISPSIVAEGYAVSLITVLSGLFIFILSGIAWFYLRWRCSRLSDKLSSE